MTIEVEREMDGIYYYVSVAVSLVGEDIDARVAEDVPELEIAGHERPTGQAIQAPTGTLAFAKGDEIDLDEPETTRALFALHEESVRKAGKPGDEGTRVGLGAVLPPSSPHVADPQPRSSTRHALSSCNGGTPTSTLE